MDGREIPQDVREKILDWVKLKASKARCPVCKEQKFTLAEHFITPIIQGADGAVQLGGSTYPHFMLLCRNCAHTLFFNAVAAGIYPAVQDSPTPEKEVGDG